MAAASVIDTRNTISVPTFDGSDANWDAWRTKFEAYADLTGVGNYLEAAEAETDFISNGRMTEDPLAASTTLYALLVTKTDGKALSLVTLVPRRHGLEAWRVLKGEYEGRGGNRVAALLRGVLNPKARWEKMHAEGKDIFDMLTAWEKDVAQYRMASGSELQQEVQVATVLEHAPATYRDVLKIVPMGARQTYPALRAYLREWCLSQRGYDDLGMKTGSPMDVGQVKGKGKEGQGRQGQGQGQRRQGQDQEGWRQARRHQASGGPVLRRRVWVLRPLGTQTRRLQEASARYSREARRWPNRSGSRRRGDLVVHDVLDPTGHDELRRRGTGGRGHLLVDLRRSVRGRSSPRPCEDLGRQRCRRARLPLGLRRRSGDRTSSWRQALRRARRRDRARWHEASLP